MKVTVRDYEDSARGAFGAPCAPFTGHCLILGHVDVSGDGLPIGPEGWVSAEMLTQNQLRSLGILPKRKIYFTASDQSFKPLTVADLAPASEPGEVYFRWRDPNHERFGFSLSSMLGKDETPIPAGYTIFSSFEEWVKAREEALVYAKTLEAEIVAEAVTRLLSGHPLDARLLDGGSTRYREGFTTAVKDGTKTLMARGDGGGDDFFPGFLAGREIHDWVLRNGFARPRRRSK